MIFGGAAGSWNQSAVIRERLLSAVGRMSAPAFFIHAENDYSIAPGPALAAEMQRLGKPHALKIYPPFGAARELGTTLCSDRCARGRRTCSLFWTRISDAERVCPSQAAFWRESTTLCQLAMPFGKSAEMDRNRFALPAEVLDM